jgi:hypothetical protein
VNGIAISTSTQLALQLLQTATLRKKRAAYACFNRSLADHMIRLVPPSVKVLTFHEWSVDFYKARGLVPDFGAPGVFDRMANTSKRALSRLNAKNYLPNSK